MKNEIKITTEEITSIATKCDVDIKQAQEITLGLNPFIEERKLLIDEFNNVSSLEVTEENIPTFKSLRLKFQKNRTQGINKWHKAAKEVPLRLGQLIDAVKKNQNQVNEAHELFLENAEKHFEIQEAKRLYRLQEFRAEKLLPYFESANEVDLSGMDEDVFDAYFSAKKRACEDEQERIRLEEEAKKEAKRVNALRAERKEKVIHLWNFIPDYVKESDFAEIEEFDALVEGLELKKSNYDKEQENIRKENERLQKEAKVKENRDKARNEELKPYIIFIRDYNKMLNLPDSDYKKEFEDIKKGALDHWEHERKEQIKKAHEEEQKRVNEERAEIDRKAKERKLKAEKDEAERELKEAQEAERKRLALVELNKQNELNKGDADKVKDLIADLEALKIKYTFKSEKNRKKYAGVSKLIDKVVTYINE